MVSGWSDDVTLFLHTVAERELSDDDLRRLAAAGVKVVPGEVAGLRVEDDRLTGVRLADGTAHERTVLFVAPKALPQTGLMERLGAELQETPFGAYPVVDPDGRTSVPGVRHRRQRDGLRRAGRPRGERRLPGGDGDCRRSDHVGPGRGRRGVRAQPGIRRGRSRPSACGSWPSRSTAGA
ncbi:hypothetical protein STENM223S_02688 [Streptomyces tendae]